MSTLNLAIIILPAFCVVMLLLIWIIPSKKVKAAEQFLKTILPKMDIGAIIKSFRNK